MKVKTLNYVQNHSSSRPRANVHQANCVELALQAGQGVAGYKAVWYREGDGKKFGCKNDLYFQQTCSKLGYVVYKLD